MIACCLLIIYVWVCVVLCIMFVLCKLIVWVCKILITFTVDDEDSKWCWWCYLAYWMYCVVTLIVKWPSELWLFLHLILSYYVVDISRYYLTTFHYELFHHYWLLYHYYFTTISKRFSIAVVLLSPILRNTPITIYFSCFPTILLPFQIVTNSS